MTEKQRAAPGAAQQETHACKTDTRSSAIRCLNDQFRHSLAGGKVLVTAGVHALGAAHVQAILAKVTQFDDFKEANDPYGEHDFGAIDDASERYFWKIDYYDLNLEMGSPDPADPKKTCRVLTIMLASEY
jgi:hypothetical protein